MLSFHLHLMKPTSSTKHIIIISLLKEGYSLCQIQSKTGLWKYTIGIINKEANGDKGKSKNEFLSKLFLGDKSPIIHQTTNWRLDDAVEATHVETHIIHVAVGKHNVCRTPMRRECSSLSRMPSL